MAEAQIVLKHITRGNSWELSPLTRGTFHFENKGPESIWFSTKDLQRAYRLDSNNNVTFSALTSRLKVESDDARVIARIQFYDREEFAVWLLEQQSFFDAEEFATRLLQRSAEIIP
jgi:hypothetical protein